MTSTLAVRAEDLRVTFGETRALDGLDLQIHPGQIHAILGPNGAGKTTFIRVVTTLQTPTSGRAEVLGIDVTAHPEQVRSQIGVAGQYATVDEYLSGRENLLLTGTLYGLAPSERRARTTDLLERFELSDAADRVAKTYSGGMRRRLDLAAALMGNPRVLFLDEPTTGLDVRTRGVLWEEVRQTAARGVSIVLTTQYLEEADALADEVSIIDHGRLVAGGTPAELKAAVGEEILVLVPEDAGQLAAMCTAVGGEVYQDAIRVRTARDGVTSTLLKAAEVGRLAQVNTSTASLDDVFLAYTGHGTQE